MHELTEGRRALVLGGGGPVGRAWESGLISKLVAQGVRLRSAELILGTSAGAILGAQLRSNLTLPLPHRRPDSLGLLQSRPMAWISS